MTITRRLLLTLSIALLGMLLVGAYGIRQLQLAQANFNQISLRIIPGLEDLTEAQQALAVMRGATP